MKTFNIIRKQLLALMLMAVAIVAHAQSNSNRINFGVGALYERGFDATLSVEHETKRRSHKCPKCSLGHLRARTGNPHVFGPWQTVAVVQ